MPTQFTCTQCSLNFNNAVQFGCHRRTYHYERFVSSNTQVSTLTNTPEPPLENIPAFTAPASSDDFLHESFSIPANVADRVNSFFESYHDSKIHLFQDNIVVDPTFQDLCHSGKTLLKFCCSKQLTQQEIRDQYHLFTQATSSSPESVDRTELLSQFPTDNTFSLYVTRAKRSYVNAQGWHRAKISISGTINTSGVFRSITQLLNEQLSIAGGLKAIQTYCDNAVNGN